MVSITIIAILAIILIVTLVFSLGFYKPTTVVPPVTGNVAQIAENAIQQELDQATAGITEADLEQALLK